MAGFTTNMVFAGLGFVETEKKLVNGFLMVGKYILEDRLTYVGKKYL